MIEMEDLETLMQLAVAYLGYQPFSRMLDVKMMKSK